MKIKSQPEITFIVPSLFFNCYVCFIMIFMLIAKLVSVEPLWSGHFNEMILIASPHEKIAFRNKVTDSRVITNTLC